MKREHGSDSPQVIAVCLSCERSFCPGECGRTRTATLRRRSWEREQEFLDLYQQGLSDPQIAAAMGLAVTTVYTHRMRRDLPANRFLHRKERKALA